MKVDEATELIRQQMWEAYFESHDVQLRNELAMEYMDVVKYYVNHLRSTYENYADREDMMNQATIALLESVEKYNPEHGAKFESYASLRVKGAIIDFVRKQDWVPKRSKHDAKIVGEAAERLTVSLGRTPTTEEIAKEVNLSPKEVERIQGEIHIFTLLSYEELLDLGVYGAKGYKEQVDAGENIPSSMLEINELKELLASKIAELSEKEQLVLSLYYYESFKIKEIADILNVSSSRVCQIHTTALKKMKKHLAGYMREGGIEFA